MLMIMMMKSSISFRWLLFLTLSLFFSRSHTHTACMCVFYGGELNRFWTHRQLHATPLLCGIFPQCVSVREQGNKTVKQITISLHHHHSLFALCSHFVSQCDNIYTHALVVYTPPLVVQLKSKFVFTFRIVYSSEVSFRRKNQFTKNSSSIKVYTLIAFQANEMQLSK